MAQYGLFPTVETKDLNGRTLTLPRDLPGDPTLVLVAFTQAQQAGVNRWITALDLKNEPDTAWIEMPAVAGGTRIIAPMLDSWMRGGIPDPDMRARTITVYGRDRFLEAFDLRSIADVCVVVVEQSGTIRLVVQGPPNPERIGQIREAMAGQDQQR